jgi:RND superfamily putative drug exporter
MFYRRALTVAGRSRYRALLSEGHDPDEAAARAINTSGRAVALAATIVVLALLGMLLLNLTYIQGIAIACAIGVALTMMASLTLLPALLSLIGHRVNRFRVPGRHPERAAGVSPKWSRWAEIVCRRRWFAAVGVTTLLVAIALPLLTMRLGSSDAGNDSTSMT